jgi:hypothetical protein
MTDHDPARRSAREELLRRFGHTSTPEQDRRREALLLKYGLISTPEQEQRRQKLLQRFGLSDDPSLRDHPTDAWRDASGELWCCFRGRTTSYPSRCRGSIARGRGHCPFVD